MRLMTSLIDRKPLVAKQPRFFFSFFPLSILFISTNAAAAGNRSRVSKSGERAWGLLKRECPMAPPKERKRKFHRRSKNGCQTCKKRHVRCDERKPLCTSCLHSGSDCIYPSREVTPYVNREVVKLEVVDRHDNWGLVFSQPLNDYVGGSFDTLPEGSKALLRHYAVFSVRGQYPIVRENDLSVINKAFENPGYMHMCLVLAACQWAWVKGTLDEVTLPFLHHKSATYRFVREQLLSADTATTRETNLAISTLALTEAAIGDLETSTKHLMGFRTAMQRNLSRPSLPQKMLKTMNEGLRQMASVPNMVPVSEYQPTFLALIFTSIWDITALPPTEAPKYGWWEAASVWQNHTKHLNLNYELSRGFNPDTYKPRILNGDPRSSRTCFIATFFYLVSEVGAGQLDLVLVDWLLEQLIDDITTCEQRIGVNPITGPLWLWYVLFGAAVADSSRAADMVEAMQLAKWKAVFEDKLSIVNETLGFTDWDSAEPMLSGIAKGLDHEGVEDLRRIWEGSTFRKSSSGRPTSSTTSPQATTE